MDVLEIGEKDCEVTTVCGATVTLSKPLE